MLRKENDVLNTISKFRFVKSDDVEIANKIINSNKSSLNHLIDNNDIFVHETKRQEPNFLVFKNV